MQLKHSSSAKFWSFLGIGFVLTCLVTGGSVWVSTGATLERFQDDFLHDQGTKIAQTLDFQIEAFENGLEYLARRPRIYGTVLGDETDTANAWELIRHFDLYEQTARVVLFDILGDKILDTALSPPSETAGRQPDGDWIDPSKYQGELADLFDTATPTHSIYIHEKVAGTDLVLIIVPVLGPGGAEGALAATFRIDLARASENTVGLRQAEIVVPGTLARATGDQVRQTEISIGHTGLNLRMTWSLRLIREEHGDIFRHIFGALLAGLSFAFLGLGWLGSRLVLAPQRMLEKSRIALAESEVKARELAMIAEMTTDPVAINDPEGRMIWCNRGFTETFGYTAADVGGRRTRDLISGPRTAIMPVNEAYRTQMAFRGEVVFYDRHDNPIDMLLSVNPVRDDDGHVVRYISIGHVISDIKRRETLLEDARAKAEAASHAKTTFLANMSHEIRTPMNGIIGMSELLNETEMSPEQRHCVTTIGDSASALLTIINDILDFSKVEAGKQVLVTGEFDFYAAAHDVIELLAPTAREKNISLCIDYPDSVPHHFIGDASRVRQILMNIVGNAVKFTAEGHVKLSLRVEGTRTGSKLCAVVEDTGIGIPESKLKKIFRAFEQVDNARTRQYGGTGLGLAIAKRLTELMGGTISVSSKEGSGTRFHICLGLEPLARPEAAPLAPGTDLSGRHILIVENCETSAQILADRLSERGAITTVASTGERAMQMVHDRQPPLTFDLGLFAHEVPDIDGEMLLLAMKGLNDTVPFPAIMMSYADRMANHARLQQLGFSGSLFKPVRSALLYRSVAVALAAPGELPGGPEQHANTHRPDSTSRFDGLRILAAEDNLTNQLVLRKMLDKTGASLEIYDNGRELLDRYCNTGADLILMDLSMPVMGGLEASRKIREFEQEMALPACPIVALTANVLPQHKEECDAAGMSDFLGKPLRKKELLQILARWQPSGTGDETQPHASNGG